MKKTIAAVLIICVICSLTAPAFSDDVPETGSMSVMKSSEIDEIIRTVLAENKSGVSVALYCVETGEEYFYNADKWMYTASLYKMPVCMKYANLLKNGDVEKDSLSGTDDYVFSKIIGFSDYGWTKVLQNKVYGGNFKAERLQDLEYSGFASEELPVKYYSTLTYSARFYLGILKELYLNSDEYPAVLEKMKIASPTKYLNRNLKDRYTIAQKYGSDSGFVHAGGIIFAPDITVIMVIMTNVGDDIIGNKLIGDLSEKIMEYLDK